ncbi:MAG: FHA domain-containing protein [Polyangiaceae bacterium]
MFAIIISEKGGAERRESYDRTEISVGRVQGNDLMLPKGNVSKRHARLLYRDGRFIVTDLKSTNGTYVNGRKIAQATIVREGDKIYIGDFVLRIEAAAGIGNVAGGVPEESGPVHDGVQRDSQHSQPAAADRRGSIPDDPRREQPVERAEMVASPLPMPPPAAMDPETSEVSWRRRRGLRWPPRSPRRLAARRGAHARAGGGQPLPARARRTRPRHSLRRSRPLVFRRAPVHPRRRASRAGTSERAERPNHLAEHGRGRPPAPLSSLQPALPVAGPAPLAAVRPRERGRPTARPPLPTAPPCGH